MVAATLQNFVMLSVTASFTYFSSRAAPPTRYLRWISVKGFG